MTVQDRPAAAPKELTDAQLISLWRESGRDPLRFAKKLQEATADAQTGAMD